MCTDESHRIVLDNCIEDVIGASENASRKSIPDTRALKDSADDTSKRKVIPGWSDLVVPKKEEAKFNYQLWLSANKPRTDDLFKNMWHSRNQSKYAKRQVFKRHKFVDACVSGDKDLFKEINNLKDMYHGIDNRTGSSQSLESL